MTASGWLGVCVITLFGALLVTVVATAGVRAVTKQEAMDRGAILLKNAQRLVRPGIRGVILSPCLKCGQPILSVISDTVVGCGNCGARISPVVKVPGS